MLLIKRDMKIEMLKKVPIFHGLSKKHLIQIAKIAESVAVKAGRKLTEQGKPGSEFYYVMEGKAQVEKDGKKIRRLNAGDFFGEISLLDRQPRTASVIAETDMKLLEVGMASFDRLLDTASGLKDKIILALCRYIRMAEKPAANL